MGKQKRHTAEQIFANLREADVEPGRGVPVCQICRKLEISEHTYYRWRKGYGGLKVDRARRLKELEKENARLKKLVADQALDNAILREAAKGNFCAQRLDGRPSGGPATSSASTSAGPAGCCASTDSRNEEPVSCPTTRTC